MEITTVHDYSIEKILSQTGYSKVYVAYDETQERSVCIKEIDLSVYENRSAKESLAKIETEVTVLRTLSDETTHIPCLLETHFDSELGKYYIVMQYFRGETLRAKMNKISEKAFLTFLVQICDTLDVMHSKRYYHKDIKPENIMLTQAGEVVLLDFNISVSNSNINEGTVGYRAPETELSDSSPDRTGVDVFALGAIMYEYYTGQKPINNMHYSCGKNRWADFVRPNEIRAQLGKNPISETKENIILKCMSFLPRDRYSAKQLREELRKLY
ncbi:MAG: serine/threonine protein kinase [Clostridia bacterium]|nr:serine/threonine protein kinase [Clostridia bacterium]